MSNKPVDFQTLPRFCTVCGTDLKRSDTVIYLSAGALPKTRTSFNRITDRLFAFIECSHHQIFNDMINGENDAFGTVSIVKDVAGGQFDIGFCSIDCLQNFFLEIVAKVQASVSAAKDARGKA